MECHRCKHSEEIAAGKYANTPFRKTPCAKCKLEETSRRTREFDLWRVDASVGPEDVAASEFLTEKENGDLMPVSVLSVLAEAMLALPGELRDVVCSRLAGMSYKEIAKVQGTAVTTAEMRHQRAMRLSPCLWAAFSRKVTRRKLREIRIAMVARKQAV